MKLSQGAPVPRDAGSLTALGALILANVTPLVGVFFFEWDTAMTLMAYWFENLVVGTYTILKMAMAACGSGVEHLQKLFMIPFFCLHFGAFCAGHGMFLLGFVVGDEAGFSVFDSLDHGMAWGRWVFCFCFLGCFRERLRWLRKVSRGWWRRCSSVTECPLPSTSSGMGSIAGSPRRN